VKVLLDTNALTLPVQFKIDLFGELGRLLGSFEPLVLKESLQELERLANGRGKDAAAAQVGIALSERCTIMESDPMPGTVDEKIVRFAKRSRAAVVTNDAALKEILKEQGIQVISMRRMRTLEMVGSTCIFG
jgi:rRNA-processing protein FCF1